MEELEPDLPDDTPQWARTFMQFLSGKVNMIEQSLGQSINYVSQDVMQNSATIAALKTDSMVMGNKIDLLTKERKKERVSARKNSQN